MRYSAIRTALAGGVLLVAGGLTGCAVGPAPEPQPAPVESVEASPEADHVAAQQRRLRERQQRIDRLLELAEQALANDRLRYPEDDNAFDWYQRVLDLDELNADAHWGMQRITQRYLTLAEQAFAAGRPVRAESMLRGALQVAATPAQVQAVRDKYRDQLDKVFALASADLGARNAAIREELAAIARRAREADSRLLIVARNDAEGRWMYQQMREAVDGYRLRGNIEIAPRPRVVLIDL